MRRKERTAALLLSLALLAGCGLKSTPEPTSEPSPEPMPAETAEPEEAPAGLPNPLRESSEEEIAGRFGLDMKAPEGAAGSAYTIIEGEKPLAQLVFSLDGTEYCFRAARLDGYEDISGMYYEWKDVAVGEGAGGSARLIAGGPGVIDRFDAESGTVYSLSMDRGASPEALERAAKLLWGPTPEEELDSLLDAFHGRYYPGTAGSSLTAAACAAELADYFFESGLSPDAVSAIVQRHGADYPPEEARLFELQLDGIVAAFSYLSGENGADLLADSGCAPAHFPWDGENVRNCFVALLGSD